MVCIMMKGVRPKGSKWLGFAGSWFLIKTKEKTWLTNNLFVTTELHEKLLINFEHNINCEIYGVYYWQDIERRLATEEFNKLKDTTGYKYFINGYNYEFMDREYNKKTL